MLFGSEVFLRIKVAVEFLTDQYPAILTSHLVINTDIYLRFISIIAVSRAPSLPTNAGSSLSPEEKVTSNSITYIIGIVVAVMLLVLIAVAFYCYWRKVTSNSITYIIGIVVAVMLLVLIAVAFYCYWRKVTSNSITYIIGIVVAVMLLVLIAVAFYCYWRKQNRHGGNQAYDPQGKKKKFFLRSDRQAERSLKRDYYQKKIRALMPNRTATITRKAEKVANHTI